MGYFNFPHTRSYDDDLGFLIKRYNQIKDLEEKTIEDIEELQKRVDDLFNYIDENIKEITEEVTKEQLQEWLDNGTLLEQLQPFLAKVQYNMSNTINLGYKSTFYGYNMDNNGNTNTDPLELECIIPHNNIVYTFISPATYDENSPVWAYK